MFKKLLLILAASMLISSLFSATISGLVVNKSNGQPIEYVNVIIKESQVGSVTNHKGYFVITGLKPGQYTVLITAIGFSSINTTVTINKDSDDAYSKFEIEKKSLEGTTIKVVSQYEDEIVNTPDIKVSNYTRSTEQLQDMVSLGEADVIRSIITLPGVAPISDFSSGMYVRGGSPDQNLILIDDIDVYNPNHFGGIFSTFNTDAVDNVELLKGGFPAKYGERLSSVLNVRNRDGNRKKFEGIGRLSLISSSVTMEGPWHLGENNGSVMGSFRRSYMDLLQGLIDGIPDYYFYDGHLKANYDLDINNRLSVSTYFGRDQLKMDIGPEMTISWGNRTFTSQWVHIFNPQFFSHFIIAGSTFDSKISMKTDAAEDQVTTMDRINSIDDITFKSIMSYKPNNEHNLEFGFENKINGIKFEFKSSEDYDPEKTPKVNTTCSTTSLYIQDTWDFDSFWSIQPGVRMTSNNGLKSNLPASKKANYYRASPRLSIRRILDVDSNVYFSYGRYYQYLTLVSPGMSTPFDLWFPLDKSVKPGESDHYILGYKRSIMEGLGIDIEAYYKTYNNLVEYRPETDFEWNNSTGQLKDIFNMGKGNTKGIDFLLRTDLQGLSGFVGYTYGITQRKIENYNTNPDSGEPEYFYPKYDRTHTMNIVESFNYTQYSSRQFLGADLKFGLTYSLASGQPDPLPEKIYFDGNNYQFLYSYSDSKRLPYYSRLDVNVKLQFNNAGYSIEPYIQIINMLNRKNVWSRNYTVKTNNNTGDFVLDHEDSTQFPLMPFIGVDIKF